MNKPCESRHATPFAVGSGLNLMAGSVLLISAVLRETPEFWRNAGGFPVLLREVVSVVFYPGMVMFAIGVLSSTWIVLRWRQNSALPVGVWIAGAIQWLLLLVVIAVFAWNNLHNLLTGASLHQHSR